MNGYFASAIIGISLLLTLGNSEAAVKRCETCYSDYDFKNMARTMGPGQHLIFNLHDNILQQWRVPYDTPPTEPFSTGKRVATASVSTPTKEIPPAAAVEELNKAHQIYVLGGALRPFINVPISVLDLPFAQNKTAYDVVYDANLRGMIESEAAHPDVIDTVTGQNVLTAIVDLASMATTHLGLRDQTGLSFRIVMTDGSYFYVTVELDKPIGSYVEGSARTNAGQIIPEELSDVQGTWYGTGSGGDNLTRMVSHMQTLGATVQYSGPSSGAIISIVCAGDICVITVHE